MLFTQSPVSASNAALRRLFIYHYIAGYIRGPFPHSISSFRFPLSAFPMLKFNIHNS